MKAVVWSKDQCPNCDQAKALLTLKGVDFEERNISKGFTKEELLAAVPNARSVPQIFIDADYIGGYQELKRFFKE
ncbi:MAG TPA: glutaredoxin domain-containing protein [Methanosarcina sp.]|nr:glutaredoxin domain-containing protein [Methanosarcina sp.]